MYSPITYAKAFVKAVAGKMTPQKEERIVKNFLDLVKKNRDTLRLKKILLRTEELLRKKSGRNKWTFETARQLDESLRKQLLSLVKTGDIVEEKIDPQLIAGVKIIINDEIQLDQTLAAKLKKLFKHI